MAGLGDVVTTEAVNTRPSIARAVGFVALGWAVITLVLQLVVAAQSSRLPSTVLVYLPGYRGGRSSVMEWNSGSLVAAGWVLAGALVLIAVVGILIATTQRIWVALVLVVVAAVGAWLTAAYVVSALLQVGPTPVSDATLRSVVDPVAVVAIVVVLVTTFFGARLLSFGTLGRSNA